MNPKTIAYIEAGLFTLIGFLSPIADKLTSDAPLSSRSIIAMIVFALIGGANALKATLSQSSQNIREPKTLNVPVEKIEPVKVEATK